MHNLKRGCYESVGMFEFENELMGVISELSFTLNLKLSLKLGRELNLKLGNVLSLKSGHELNNKLDVEF